LGLYPVALELKKPSRIWLVNSSQFCELFEAKNLFIMAALEGFEPTSGCLEAPSQKSLSIGQLTLF